MHVHKDWKLAYLSKRNLKFQTPQYLHAETCTDSLIHTRRLIVSTMVHVSC